MCRADEMQSRIENRLWDFRLPEDIAIVFNGGAHRVLSSPCIGLALHAKAEKHYRMAQIFELMTLDTKYLMCTPYGVPFCLNCRQV